MKEISNSQIVNIPAGGKSASRIHDMIIIIMIEIITDIFVN
jgi:hypothetical protein